MFVVGKFRVEGETQYFGVCVHVECGVVDLQIKFCAVFCRIRGEKCACSLVGIK